jgi:hypothetical protein
MIQGERIVSYDIFMEILADAKSVGLCNAPDPASIPGLTAPGTMMVLALEEWGCRGSNGDLPLHHKVRAVALFERVVHFVDVEDARWAVLPTVDQYFSTLPTINIPAELYAEIAEEQNRERLAATAARIAEISKGISERPASSDTGEEPPTEEDGGSGVREPLPEPCPTDDTGAAIPSEVPVG